MRGCWLCRLYPEQQERCRKLSPAKPQMDHIIEQRVIKRECKEHERSMRDLIADPRNLRPLRVWHHEMWTRRLIPIQRAQLGPDVEQFAVEVGLVWWLDRTYGPMRAAA